MNHKIGIVIPSTINVKEAAPKETREQVGEVRQDASLPICSASSLRITPWVAGCRPRGLSRSR